MLKSLIEKTFTELELHTVNRGTYAGRWIERSSSDLIESINPATGEVLGAVQRADADAYEMVMAELQRSFDIWRSMPPPARGELVRQLGLALRRKKEALGALVTLEAGKIISEGQGEVQEMIDMCDFSVGLSRQLYGLTIASERPQHRMFEQWHPLGTIGVITSFNFPVAVWAWNAAIAFVCGDPVLWKPSTLTPLTAVAVTRIAAPVLERFDVPGLLGLAVGRGDDIGQQMTDDRRLPLISATGSCAMGRVVGQRVAARLGRSLLELGGNNGAIVTETADLELVIRAVVFAAVGTAGQRCTTLRRLFVHRSIADHLLERLHGVYRQLPIGNPWEPQTLVGPLIRDSAVSRMQEALEAARSEGAEIVYGGEPLTREGFFVRPAIVHTTRDLAIARQETFAPILYVHPFDELDEAIAWHNDVDQGLSSAIFTDRLREAERFLSPTGSDCGIANVNIGTSGAEIGGAFGGEKETGGGREAGSDAWKAYMRRQTCTINYGDELPLAQGVRFDL